MNTANPLHPTALSSTSGACLTNDASFSSSLPAAMAEAHPIATPIPVPPELPYHRLAHVTPSSGRWWRPFVMLLTFVVMTVFVTVVAMLAYWGVTTVFPEIPSPSETLDDARNPADIAVGFGFIALLLPIVLLTMLASGRRGTIASVVGRFRWRLMTGALTVMLPFYAVLNAVGLLAEGPGNLSLPTFDGRLLAVVVIAVLVVPVQAAAEEFLFRGLIPQMIGTWLRSPLWGVLVSAPLFVWGHGYDAWGLADIAVFALCAHYLTWKSGGVELSSVMHIANNLTLTLLAVFSPGALQQGAVAPTSLLVSVPMTLGATLWLSRQVSTEYGLGRFQPLLRSRDVRAV